MKIKTKLTLGVGLLFLLIILLGGMGIKAVNELKADTENILVANYNSLEYARNMLGALENNNSKSILKFEKNLIKQEHNNTEIGERETTNELRESFDDFKLNSEQKYLVSIKQSIYKIIDLNMQAIKRKSEFAKITAKNANLALAMTGTLCFLIAFTLLINLPASIANPIKELTQSIKEIASKKYTQRVRFESNSEFGELANSFNTMAQKLEEYNNSNLAQLMIEKKRIETLINNMHDPVLGLDENLNILFANEEALNIIDLKKEDLIGKKSHDLALKNDLIRLLVNKILEDKNQRLEKIKPFKIFANGKESYFEKEILDITITPTGENVKLLVGHVIILRDVTEYKELEFAKTNFIATVSHEFKTPISSIKMSLQLLENNQIGELNLEQNHLINSIKEDTNRLLKITGELLNMTQVESGNIQLKLLPSSPIEILNAAVDANRVIAEQKQIKFDINCSEDLQFVNADHEKTVWVLTNLISNAIRFSHENTCILLTISKIENNIFFKVKDYGQGILPQYLPKIFDRYFKVPGTEKSGTGLGLAISKEFIEAQGGTITVDSEYGKGSVFTISLKN
jgi:PAS domain S-box-containing protein